MKIDQIIEYYDGIQIFIGIKNESKYICTLLNREEDCDRYLAVITDKYLLQDFLNKKIDLRGCYLEEDCYILEISEDSESMYSLSKDKLTEDMLPSEGYYCKTIENE